MIMAESESSTLTRKSSRGRLHKSSSKLSIDTKIKDGEFELRKGDKANTEKNENKNNKERVKEHGHAHEKSTEIDNEKRAKEKDDKKGRRTKKKGKSGKEKANEERNDTKEKKSSLLWISGPAEKKENFRDFVYHKVQTALSLVYTDGVTEISIDNVMDLMKSLDLSTTQEDFIDLIRSSAFDNFGEIQPLELDSLVMKGQEKNKDVDVDECLDSAFHLIDFDDDGYITQKDIKMLMLRLGEKLGDYAVDDMLAAVDMDKDGKIDLPEFRHFLLGRSVPRRKEFQTENEVARKSDEMQRFQQSDAPDEVDIYDTDEQSRDGANKNVHTVLRNNVLSLVRSAGKIIKFKSDTGTRKTTSDQERRLSIDVNESNCSSVKTEQPSVLDNLKEEVDKSSLTPRETLYSTKRRCSFFGGFAKMILKVSGLTTEAKKKEKLENGSKMEIDQRTQKFAPDDTSIPAQNPPDKGSQEGRETSEMKVSAEARRSSQGDVRSYEIGQHRQDCEWEESPMPSPHISKVDLSNPPLKSASSFSVQQVKASDVDDSLFIPTAEHGKAFAGVVETPGQRIWMDNQEHATNKRASGYSTHQYNNEDFNNTLILKLRQGRKSNSSIKSVHTNFENTREDGGVFNSSDDKCYTDSDEGIELVDEDVIQESLRIPFSSIATPASLRIYLPLGDLGQSDAQLVKEKPRKRQSRSQITINLRNFSVQNEHNVDEEIKMKDNKTHDNNKSQDNKKTLSSSVLSSTVSKSEMTEINPSFMPPRHDDFYSEDTEDENNYRDKCERNPFSPTSKSIFSVLTNQSVYGSEDYAITASQYKERLKHYRHPARHQKTEQNSGNQYGYCIPKSPHRALTFSAEQDDARRSGPRNQSLSYQTVEFKELELGSEACKNQFWTQGKSIMIPREIPKFRAVGKSSGVDGDNSVNDMNKIKHGVSHQRVHLKQLNPFTSPGKSRRTQAVSAMYGERERTKSRTTRLLQDECFLPSEKTMNDCSRRNIRSIKWTRDRKLQRSKTSFDLATFRESGNRADYSNTSTSICKKRSLSATTRSSAIRPHYRSVHVLDLSRSLPLENSFKRNNPLSKRHYEVSRIIPLSRVINTYQSVRTGYQNHTYSISRDLEKGGVPYFLHSSSRLDTDTRIHSFSKRKRSKKTSSNSEKQKKRDRSDTARGTDVPTLISELKDPDVIPDEVIFENVRCLAEEPTNKS